MALSNHKELRFCCEWAFPGRFAQAVEAWDGEEDPQDYIDRAWSWKEGAKPVTASEIVAKEDDWRTALEQRAKSSPSPADKIARMVKREGFTDAKEFRDALDAEADKLETRT